MAHDQRPYAPACDRNREPILAVLRQYLPGRRCILEIGSGTGQHAVHFARAFPDASWQCTDLAENLPGIGLWLAEAGLPNTPPARCLDVTGDWPAQRFDAVFSANTLHIMSWPTVETMFARLASALADDALVIVYGPFNYGGHYTSDSNAQFDEWLKARDPRQGIRDFESVDTLAQHAGLELVADHAMPANNRTLVWRRRHAITNGA